MAQRARPSTHLASPLALRLYFDEDAGQHVVVRPLREGGISLLTAAEARTLGSSDEEQLTFAASQQRVLVTHNVQDFYRIHSTWLRAGRSHAGLILVHQGVFAVGERIRRLRLICAERTPEQMRDRAEFLSTWG